MAEFHTVGVEICRFHTATANEMIVAHEVPWTPLARASKPKTTVAGGSPHPLTYGLYVTCFDRFSQVRISDNRKTFEYMRIFIIIALL